MDQICFNICLWILSIIIAVSVCSILIKSKKFNKCSCNHRHIEGYEEAKEISVNSVNTDNITVKNDLGLKNKIMLYNGNDKSIELDNDTGKIKGTSLYGQVYGDVTGNVTGTTIKGTNINSTNITNSGNITNNGTFTNKGSANFNDKLTVSGRITGKDLRLLRDIDNGGNIYANGFVYAHKGLIASDIDTIKIGGKKLLDIIYPIGSIYQTTSYTNPAILFGGKWEQIKDRFLYSASNGSTLTGGSSTVTLDIENIPSHNHEFRGDLVTDTISQDNRCGILRQDKRSGIFRTSGWKSRRIRDEGGPSYDLRVEYRPSGTISHTGGSKNNKHRTKPLIIMPPYYKVFTWRRTG